MDRVTRLGLSYYRLFLPTFSTKTGVGARSVLGLLKNVSRRTYGASVPGSIRRRQAREALA